MSKAGSFYDYAESPLGELEICVNDDGLISLLFVKKEESELTRKKSSSHKYLCETKRQLQAYFEKRLNRFDIPLNLNGTEFQKRVWNELTRIPNAKTISYLELARKLGDEKCIRAAASANGKNPIAIIVPCHRVIGSNGSLIGYSGELWRKQWLLEHESKQHSLFHTESPILGEAIDRS